MITYAILNQFLNLIDYILTGVLNPFYIKISDLGTSIGALQVPATIYDILSLTIYFLPIGTIVILFNITLVMLAILISYAFIYMLLDFIKHIPFL